MTEFACNYCNRNAVLVDSAEVYGRSYGGQVWYCRPCSAWVGAHPGGGPKGTLAKAELRRLRMQFHAAFDRLWKPDAQGLSGRKRSHLRGRWYAKLAEATDMPVAEVHGGRLTEETAPVVLAALEKLRG